MEEKSITSRIKKILLKIVNYAIFTLLLFNAIIILELHMIIHFFPVLFLLDFCFIIGYPLFLRYVLKKKWFDCARDDYLALKYIMIPLLILELVVLLCYPHDTNLAINILAEDKVLKNE